MREARISLVGVALMLVVATYAFAIDPAYVSVRGRDSWPCNRAKPCRTFARALTVTDLGGTVVALDSGVFSDSHLIVSQAVTIEAVPGARAELRESGFALSVNATLSDVVVLRNLTFTGDGSTFNNGIVLNAAEALHVENCVVSGFGVKGILSLSVGELYVLDSVFRNNFIGISLDGPTTASMDSVRLEDGHFGLFASFGAQVTVKNSVASGHSFAGFSASEGAGGVDTVVNIEDSMAANNDIGIEARGSGNDIGIVRVSHSVVTGNHIGLQVGQGVIETRGNNTVAGNLTNVNGVLTLIPGT